MFSTYLLEIKYTAYILWVFLFWYLHIEAAQLSILWILMLIDTITWVTKRYKLNEEWDKVSSAWLTIWALRKLLTLLAIFTISLTLKGLGVEAYYTLMFSIIAIFIVAQAISIMQNIYSSLTWKKVDEQDAISIVIRVIGSFLLNELEKRLWNKK